MKVVDAVQVHVLGVPGKRRLPAAEVKVGRVHAVYLDAVVLNIRLLKETCAKIIRLIILVNKIHMFELITHSLDLPMHRFSQSSSSPDLLQICTIPCHLQNF